jgi:glycosyltransferase involved in cell wall biosynthesis
LTNPVISIICPVYNEEHYLDKVLRFVTTASPSNKEIIFIDGMSKDRTVEILKKWQTSNPEIRIISNPQRTVPFALNLAIPVCTGQYIVRLDAHTDYAEDYFEQILKTFDTTDADIVGGPTRTASNSPFQEAVAYIFNTPLGMGDGSVHNTTFEGYTDSVTFGSWKRSIFEKTGLFDVKQKRNQDDEFHYRARSLGFKIYQNPDIKLFYYPRNTVSGLFKQYYDYGLYKPMVLRKIKSGIRLRHIVPSLFVLYLIACILIPGWVSKFPLLIYLALCAFFAIKSAKSIKLMFLVFIAYLTVHIGYGLGFLLGLRKLL